MAFGTAKMLSATLPAMAVLASAIAVACGPSNADSLLGSDDLSNQNGGGGGSWGNGGGGPSYTAGGDGGSKVTQAEALYRALQPSLEMKCGGACHQTGATLSAPKYLAGPDSYVSIKAYPGIVTDDVYASKLLNRPSGHPASTLVDSGNEQLLKDVTTWLNAEAAALAATPLPSAGPVDLTAGSIDLSMVAMGMTGAKLTFKAQLVSNYARFDTLQITAPSTSAIHVVAPIFVMMPADNSAPVVDKNFSSTDLTINAGQTASLAVPYFFFGWTAGSKLKVEFTKIELTAGSPDAGSSSACKDVATFQSSAAPELINTCVGCHGGGSAGAQSAMDLSALKGGSPDYATACNQAHFKVNTTNHAMSNILLAPLSGSGLTHGGGKPYGSTSSPGYVAIANWVNKE